MSDTQAHDKAVAILREYIDAHEAAQMAEVFAAKARQRRAAAGDLFYTHVADGLYAVEALGEFVTIRQNGRWYVAHLDVDGDGAHELREIPAPIGVGDA